MKKKLSKKQRIEKKLEHVETWNQGFEYGFQMGYEKGFKEAAEQMHRNVLKFAHRGR